MEKLLMIHSGIALVLCAWILAVYGYGFMLFRWLARRYICVETLWVHSHALGLLLVLLLGGFGCMFFVALWHLFFPLWWWVSVLIVVLGVVCFSLYGRQFFANKRATASALLALLVVLPISAMSDSVGDSVNYHIQITTWIQESPLVFGLGHVHTRLGYNGLIYGFYALTDVAQIIPHLRSFVGNEILYFGLLFSAFMALFSLLERLREPRFYELFIICALVPFPLILKWPEFRGLYVEGVGVVFGVAVFATLLYIWDCIQQDSAQCAKLNENKTTSPRDSRLVASHPIVDSSTAPLYALLFVCALFATMVKIANFALILAVVASFVLTYRSQALNRKLFLRLCGLGALSIVFALPWVLKGLASSGMIAYPASIGYIASLPWAVSEETRLNEVCWIMGWARAPMKNCHEVMADSMWMLEWFSMKTRYFDSYFKHFVYTLFLGSVFALARLWYRKGVAGFTAVLVCIGVGVVYWFIAGPDPRFGMVYLIPLLAILLAYVLMLAYRARSLWLACGFMLTCVPMFMNGRYMFVIVLGVLLVLYMSKLRAQWLVWLCMICSLISVPNLYRHDLWAIIEYPKVRGVYVQERISDLGVREFVRFDEPNEHTKEIAYEARPMTPYFNQYLGKGEFLGREMFYTHKPIPNAK